MKILIVEDEMASRFLLQTWLREFGITHVAVDGEEAVKAVELAIESNEPYDLICMDIMMPNMDGKEAVDKIRKLEESKGTFSTDGAKIIMTTATMTFDNVVESYRNLCDGYLTKPYGKQKLIGEMERLNLFMRK